MTCIKDRLVKFISTTGEGQGKFEKKCGLPNGFVSNIKEGISTGSLMKIYTACPELNIEWLVAGAGEMHKATSPPSTAQVDLIAPADHGDATPYFNIEFKGMAPTYLPNQEGNPNGYIDIPAFREVDCWVNATDMTMDPVISRGDIIALKEIHDLENSVMYGEIYAIVMREIKIIKKIMPSQLGKEYIRIEAINSTLFPPKEIERSSILKVYKVMGNIKQMM